MRATIAAARQAREVFERCFAGVGTVGAAAETFLGCGPLLVVEPLSLLIVAVCLAEGRGAADWEPVFAGMEALEQCACDGGRGLNRAGKDAGLELQADLFHGLRQASTGSVADEVELAVLEAVDRAVRSSSVVECANARVRLVQVARKRLGEDFL